MAGRSMALLAHGVNAILLALMWAFALWAYDKLPDPIPIHFDAAGNPNGWAEKSYLSWLMLPSSALGMTVITYASVLFVALTRKNPRFINFPGRYKTKYLALSPERREPVLFVVKAFVYWIAVPMNVLLSWVEWGMYHAAFDGKMSGSVWTPMIAFSVVFVVVMACGIVWMLRAVDRA